MEPPQGPHHRRCPPAPQRPGLGAPTRMHQLTHRGTPDSARPVPSAASSTCSPVQTHGAATRPGPPSGAERRGKPGAVARPERTALPPASGAAVAAGAADPAPVLRRPRARSHSTCSIVCPLRAASQHCPGRSRPQRCPQHGPASRCRGARRPFPSRPGRVS